MGGGKISTKTDDFMQMNQFPRQYEPVAEKIVRLKRRNTENDKDFIGSVSVDCIRFGGEC
jgi:hypothetical protein